MQISINKGFSLVEIMFVMVVIGVLGAIAFPLFASWVPNINLKTTVRNISENIQRAKLIAAKRNVCTGIVFTTVAFPATGGSYELFLDNGVGTSCDGTLDAGETILSNIVVERGISLVSAGNIGGAHAICVNPITVICGSQSGNIQVRNSKSRWNKTVVSASGGVRIERSNDGINWSE